MTDMPTRFPAADAAPARPPAYDARMLTMGATTAELLLDGQRYTLRITRAGKLILTK